MTAIKALVTKKSILDATCTCWFCKRFGITLYRVRDAQGKKTKHYACEEHISLGVPPVGVFEGGK